MGGIRGELVPVQVCRTEMRWQALEQTPGEESVFNYESYEGSLAELYAQFNMGVNYDDLRGPPGVLPPLPTVVEVPEDPPPPSNIPLADGWSFFIIGLAAVGWIYARRAAA